MLLKGILFTVRTATLSVPYKFSYASSDNVNVPAKLFDILTSASDMSKIKQSIFRTEIGTTL